MSAETIANALGGAYRSGGRWRCRCPVHNSEGATLALRDVVSGVQLRCFRGCRAGAIRAELRRRGLLDNSRHDPEAIERQREEDERDRGKRIETARQLYGETEAANWIIETYLGSRLILDTIPATVRLHRSLRHRETGSRRPAMVCAVEHAVDGFVGVHCTYLAPDGYGKATIEPAKRFIGPVGGGAVRLAVAETVVAIAEGIESGLSYQEATGTPTWCALSAVGIRKLVLPDEIADVVIAPDPDPVGMMAARAAAKRWLAEGRRVSIARPPLGLDFNDLARVLLG